jgi:hypothetical protein
MKAIYNDILFNGYFFENDNKDYFRPYPINNILPREIRAVEGWDELLQGVPFDSAKNTADLIEYNRVKEEELGQIKLMVKHEVLTFIEENFDEGRIKDIMLSNIHNLIKYYSVGSPSQIMISKDSVKDYIDERIFRSIEANVVTHHYAVDKIKTMDNEC